jgi:hypothetical protein
MRTRHLAWALALCLPACGPAASSGQKSSKLPLRNRLDCYEGEDGVYSEDCQEGEEEFVDCGEFPDAEGPIDEDWVESDQIADEDLDYEIASDEDPADEDVCENVDGWVDDGSGDGWNDGGGDGSGWADAARAAGREGAIRTRAVFDQGRGAVDMGTFMTIQTPPRGKKTIITIETVDTAAPGGPIVRRGFTQMEPGQTQKRVRIPPAGSPQGPTPGPGPGGRRPMPRTRVGAREVGPGQGGATVLGPVPSQAGAGMQRRGVTTRNQSGAPTGAGRYGRTEMFLGPLNGPGR